MHVSIQLSQNCTNTQLRLKFAGHFAANTYYASQFANYIARHFAKTRLSLSEWPNIQAYPGDGTALANCCEHSKPSRMAMTCLLW
jgi:hypothetical protein